MLPKLLKIQAFGPYVEAQKIVFQSFAAQHLFLIRGETGSGKTVILDAITFALYGKSSGGQRDSFELMRSRFADDEQMTYVMFEFQINDRHFRFYRSLEVRYNRNKEKQIKMKIDAGEIIDEQYYPFFENPKLRLIEDKAMELIGLNYDQFVQVMILPQGKFEQFLTSKSEDKQEILKNLFQMERYGKLIERLQERVKILRDEVQQYKQQKDVWLTQFDVQTHLELHNAKETMLWKLEEANQQFQSLLIEEEQLQKEAALYERYVAWQRNDERYLAEQNRLHVQKEMIQQIRLQCDQYQRVKAVAIDVDRVLQTKIELTKRHDEAIKAKQDLETAEDQLHLLPKWKQEYASIKERVDQMHDRLMLCDSLEDVYIACDQLIKQEQDADQIKNKQAISVEKIKKELEKFHTSYQANDIEYHRLQEALQSASSKEGLWLHYQQGYDFYREVQRLKKSNEELIKTLTTQKQQCLIAQQQVTRLHEEHEVLYQTYLESSASMLAASLEDGKPCPVCGSLHHPNPVSFNEAAVDLQQLRLKKQTYDRQKQHVEDIQRQLQKTEVTYEQNVQQIQRYQKEIQTVLEQPFCLEEYTALKEEMAQYDKDKEYLSIIMKQLTSATKHMHELQDEMQRRQQLLIMAEQDCIRIKTQLENNRVRFLKDIHTLAALHTYKDTLQHQQRECMIIHSEKEKQITDTQIAYEKAKQLEQQTHAEEHAVRQRLEKAKKDLQDVMQEHQITESDLEVLQHKSKMEALQQQITAYDQESTRLEALMQEHLLQKPDMHVIDVETLQVRQDVLTDKKKDVQAALAFLQIEIKRFTDAEKIVRKMEDALEQKEPYLLKMSDFVKTLRGDNHVGLERYVLGVMLSQITSHANTLLKNVHYGRYQLYRSDIASGRTRKHGLELEIYDSYTCSRRNVISLSGGEKFLVSLALSLALSLVVQMRNGGVRLDAMFIDEGFGTLDEHSIADALSILQTMVSAKGMVGIISHVDVLKENIPQGIEVVKTKTGSHIQIRKGDI